MYYLNIFEFLFKWSLNNIQIEIVILLIAIALVTWIMYLLTGKDSNYDKSISSLMFIIMGIVVIGIVSILRIIYDNPYKEYYFDIIITILSGLVGGVFVILSLNHIKQEYQILKLKDWLANKNKMK